MSMELVVHMVSNELDNAQLTWPVETEGSVSPAAPFLYAFAAVFALSAHLQCDLATTGLRL